VIPYEKIENIRQQLRELSFDYWTSQVVFSVQWWIIIASLILPWVLWLKLADKKKMNELILVGLQIALISYILNQIGTSLGLWTYPYTLLPLEREVWDPADFTILPVLFMLLYQWFPRWKSYLRIHVLFAFLAAYVGGFIYEWLGIYKILNWKHAYSVLIYFLIAIFVKFVVQTIIKIKMKNGS
jgi:hypothetical protein